MLTKDNYFLYRYLGTCDMVFAEVVRAVKAVVVVVSTGSDLHRIGDLSYKVNPFGPTKYIYPLPPSTPLPYTSALLLYRSIN